MPSLRSSFSDFRHSFRGRQLFSCFCPFLQWLLDLPFVGLDIRLGFFAPLPPRACPRFLSPSPFSLFPRYWSPGVVVVFRLFLLVDPTPVPVTLRPVGPRVLFLLSLVYPAGCFWASGCFFVEPRGSRRRWLYFVCLFPFGGNSNRFASLLWKVGTFLVSQVCLACIFGASRPAHFGSWAPDWWCWAVEWTEWWACWCWCSRDGDPCFSVLLLFEVDLDGASWGSVRGIVSLHVRHFRSSRLGTRLYRVQVNNRSTWLGIEAFRGIVWRPLYLRVRILVLLR